MNRDEIINKIEEKEIAINNIKNELNKLKAMLNVLDSKEEVSSLSREEKVKIFMSYFKGRDDVYPYLSINKDNPNIKYYIPACLNEWKEGVCNKKMGKKCKECQYRENKPLSEEVIYKHMYENKPIGIYPLLTDDTCYFLALDFDNKNSDNDIKEEVLAFLNVCDEYEIPAILERSRSGNGIHIWIFFSTNIKAIIARKLGSLLLSKTMDNCYINNCP